MHRGLANRPVRVFVSHNRREKAWVRRLVAQLRDLGLSVFFDEDSIQPGEVLVDAIERGIAEADHVILVLSRASLESRWVAREFAMTAVNDNRTVVPVMIEPLNVRDLRLSIQSLSILDLTDESTRDQRYRALLRSIGVTRPELPSAPALDDTGVPAEAQTRQAAADGRARARNQRSRTMAVSARVLGIVLVAAAIVILVNIIRDQPPLKGSSIAYVMDVSASMNGLSSSGRVPYTEFKENLLRSIDAVARGMPHSPQQHRVVQLGDGLMENVLCRSTLRTPRYDLGPVLEFVQECRSKLDQPPRSPGTQIDVALKYATILNNPRDGTDDIIVLFTDLMDQSESAADDPGLDLMYQCVAVFYVFPAGTSSPDAMDRLISSWEGRFIKWGARDARLWHVAAFEEESLAEFVRQCSSLPRKPRGGTAALRPPGLEASPFSDGHSRGRSERTAQTKILINAFTS